MCIFSNQFKMNTKQHETIQFTRTPAHLHKTAQTVIYQNYQKPVRVYLLYMYE